MGFDTPCREVSIAFPFVSEFSLDDIEIYHFTMDAYVDDYKNLSKDTLENIEISNDTVEGDFNASCDEICVLSIPFSKGWTAYVDGQKQDIVKAT